MVLVSHVPVLGGAERILLLLGQEMTRLGRQVLLVTPDGPLAEAARASLGPGSVRLIAAFARNYSRSRWDALRNGRRAAQVLRTLPGVPHDALFVFNHPRALPYLGWSVIAARRPAVCFVHDVLDMGSLRWLVAVLASWVGITLVCVSRAVGASLRGARPGRVQVLRNPAIYRSFRGGREPRRTVRIGMVSHIARWKGHVMVLAALDIIRTTDSEVVFTVWGQAAGPSEERHCAQVEAMIGERPWASYAGSAADAVEALRTVDVVVQGSLRPEQPLVLGEAIAAGCAVVAPGGGGEEEVVGAWPAAFWYERGTVQSLVTAVSAAIRSVRETGVPVTEADFAAWSEPRDVDRWAAAFADIVALQAPAGAASPLAASRHS